MTPSFLRRLIAIGLALLLGGCAVTQRLQPMPLPLPTPQAPPVAIAPLANGAIYQAQYAGQPGYSHRPLFEDRRARAVGDVLTININETTAASKNSASNVARTGGDAAAVTAMSGLPGQGLNGLNLAANSASTFAGKGDSASNNAFTGIITVTVAEVLSNGNMVVSGEKQIGINQGSEVVRFSGIVNPAMISSGNSVSSTQVANVRVEYRGNGYIDEAQTMGWLQRIFLSVMPF
jgi:flagellar L-ring protein precursor FlgH